MAQSSGTVKRCTPCSQARKLLPAAVRKRLERLEDKINARKAAKRARMGQVPWRVPDKD